MRQFVVVSPVLSEFSRGEVVSGDQLSSSEEGLDRTVARGWAVEIEPGQNVTVVDNDDDTADEIDVELADTDEVGDDEVEEVAEHPALNASRRDWVTFAESHGVDPDGLSRDDIVALFVDGA